MLDFATQPCKIQHSVETSTFWLVRGDERVDEWSQGNIIRYSSIMAQKRNFNTIELTQQGEE